MRAHTAILLLALAASASARSLKQSNQVAATSQGSGGPEAGASTLTIGGSDPLTGAAIQTTFTAATGKNAAVAISGESRINDDVFGRATNGASGSATEGTVTAIAAQGTFAMGSSALAGTAGSSGAAGLATASIAGTGNVRAYGTVRPGFQDVQASLSEVEGSLSTTRAAAYGSAARASIGTMVYNQPLGTLSESESLSSTSAGVAKADSTAGSGLPALGVYGNFVDEVSVTVTDAITSLTNPANPVSSAFGYAQGKPAAVDANAASVTTIVG